MSKEQPIMAWIKSYKELERHPKTMSLMSKMGWTLDTTIAKLHRLWWWCADYAYDGDLTRHEPEIVAAAVGMPPEQGKPFLEALAAAGFIDTAPCLQLHDWWEHFGPFLRGKYSRSPEIWKKVEARYVTTIKQPYGNLPLEKKRGEEKREDKIETTMPPDWLPLGPWGHYVEMRSKMRKPMTDRAKELAIKSLDALRLAGEDPVAVLEQSVMKSWLGLFPVHGDRQQGGGAAVKPGKYAEAAKGGGDVRRKSE